MSKQTDRYFIFVGSKGMIVSSGKDQRDALGKLQHKEWDSVFEMDRPS